jgi:GTP-binding protein
VQGDYRQATFLRGVARLSDLPADRGAEVAFAGRSNAGKSSVINALTGQAALARISKTPGRTQQLNFFTLDEDRRLVDLPGYGYAKVPLAIKRRWGTLVESYLSARRSLKGVILLMDARRPFTEADQQLLHWCVNARLAVHVLLNKADKLTRGPAKQTLSNASRHLDTLPSPAHAQLFSATRKTGVEELVAQLDEWLGFEKDTPPSL